MSLRPLVPHGNALRHAVRWLVEQGGWSLPLIEEACQRFDLSPADEEFLLLQHRRMQEQQHQQ